MEKVNFLTEAEAARVLGMSTATLYRLRRNGAISSYRIAGKIRFVEAQLTDFLASAERKAKDDPLPADSPASKAA